MKFIEFISRAGQRLFEAMARFPLTVLCLICAEVLICYIISLHKDPDLIIQKLLFTFLLGAFLGVTAQFTCERFKKLATRRLLVYVASILLTLGYYLILWPAPGISFEVVIRTIVAVFAMFCAFIWVPSYRNKYDFNAIALAHFKSAFISVLYAGVISAGCAAILAAIDTLLININNDSYQYMLTIVWVLFAILYYLSLLPHFNSEEYNHQEYTRYSAQYPRFLEILVAYIAIPLVAAYTLVLTAYFVKILITLKWPSGQLGVMVLAYSAAGLIIFILASLIENRFANLYRLIFPKVLIPVVIMQLVSVAIRLNAYGFTESRYYVALFGIFSMACGVLLSFKPVTKNGIIALLAAGFAIFSVLPPVDAFTVSRISQINRLESMLRAEGVLVGGKIKPMVDAPITLRIETTSILNYLQSRNYIKYLQWLPEKFDTNDKMKSTLGFEPAYGGREDNEIKNFFASLDMQKPIKIDGYDVLLNAVSDRGMEKGTQQPIAFQINEVEYQLNLERISPQDVRVSMQNSAGMELIGTDLYEHAKSISGISNQPKQALSPQAMTIDVKKDDYKMRIIFQNINLTDGSGTDSGVDYNIFVLLGVGNKGTVLLLHKGEA